MFFSSSLHLPPLILVMFPVHPLSFCFLFLFIYFYPCQPSFPFPDATKVKQEQCSVSPHLSCRNKPIHNYVMLKKPGWNKGAETQKHEEGECEMGNVHQPHASSLHHTHTNILLFHSNKGIITEHKCTWQLVRVHSAKAPKPGQWVKHKRKNNRALQRKEYLALPSGVRDLEKRNQTRRKRAENQNTGMPIPELYYH